jgi:ATP-dependent DNA helicase RecQ
LTATATERERADIVAQLKLRSPKIFIGSFNRSNLTYRVIEKSSPYEQLFTLIQERPSESGIVYCQSRKSAEGLTARLCKDGIRRCRTTPDWNRRPAPKSRSVYPG